MAAIPRPGGWWKWFTEETIVYDLGVAAAAVAPAAITGFQSFADKRYVEGWGSVAVAAVAFLLTGLKFAVQWRIARAKESPHELQGCLHTLHAVLAAAGPTSADDPRLRLTIHVPMKDGARLMQVLDYVGDGRAGKTCGRTFSATSGIIGKVYREGKAAHALRKNVDYNTYLAELRQDWNYTEYDAKRLDPWSMAWVAVPLVERAGEPLQGVVYSDSVDKDFFTQERVNLILAASAGVARYVALRNGR